MTHNSGVVWQARKFVRIDRMLLYSLIDARHDQWCFRRKVAIGRGEVLNLGQLVSELGKGLPVKTIA